VGRPLPELLAEITVSPDIDAALLGAETPLGLLLRLVVAYERGDWPAVATVGDRLHVPESSLPPIYRGALDWASETLPR